MILFTDKSDPPKEVYAREVTSTHIILAWEEPSDNGGSEITNYVIEKRGMVCYDPFLYLFVLIVYLPNVM